VTAAALEAAACLEMATLEAAEIPSAYLETTTPTNLQAALHLER
jgi:hypothetical protein